MNYSRPDVYTQDVSSSSVQATQASTTIGILLGTAKSGAIGEPVLCTSWTEYIENFASGLESPFLKDSDLAYAVYGFFLNGGNEVYTIRVASSSASKATKTATANAGLTITAKYEGDISPVITLKKNAEFVQSTNEVFDLTVKMSNADDGTVTITEVTKDNLIEKVNSNELLSNWITVSAEGLTKLAEETITLEGGNDGIADIQTKDFVKALNYCDTIEDASFLAIPGETDEVLNAEIMNYCDNKKLFPFLDMPVGSTVKETKEYRKKISAFGGALCYPWGQINDPLTNSPKLVPTAGYVMGVYSRIIGSEGVHKAPAGMNAKVKGFTTLEKKLTNEDLNHLNPVGVISIVSRSNSGIVLWGARGLNNDPSMKYVSDVLLNYNIKKTLYNNTLFSAFEPNNETLWSKVTAICQDFLETLRLSGALKGSAEEAYYVTCDSSNNTDKTIAQGMLYIDIGYAEVKPAEFIVARISHSINTNQ